MDRDNGSPMVRFKPGRAVLSSPGENRALELEPTSFRDRCGEAGAQESCARLGMAQVVNGTAVSRTGAPDPPLVSVQMLPQACRTGW